MGGHKHGGHGHHHGGGFRQGGDPVLLIDESDEGDSDPHDQLLLTSRPVTVVTQATRLLDDMPPPFTDAGDEESIFAGIGLDDGASRRAKLVRNRQSLSKRAPGIAPMRGPRAGFMPGFGDVAPATPARSLAADMTPWLIAAGLAAAVFFGGRRRSR